MSSRPNLTSSNENVVYNKDKIIHCRNKNYYILYKLKSFEKCVSSSDEDFIMAKNKHKRRRLLSRSSNETLVIDGNHISKNSQHSDNEEEKSDLNQTKEKDVSDIECVLIDDSDSTLSCNSKAVSNNEELTVRKSPAKLSVESEKVIQKVIARCYNKFLERFDDMRVGKKTNAGYVEHCLQPKILSMGQKVITSTGLNSTGLLRYMEHKDLDVNWIQKRQKTVHIKTTLRNDRNNDSCYPMWKSLKGLDKYYVPNDFIDYFEKITKTKHYSSKNKKVTNSVTQCVKKNCVGEVEKTVTAEKNNVKSSNSVLYLKTPDRENQTMLKKLLNENSVANPKQLPKKASSELISLLSNKQMSNSEESNCDKNIDKSNDEQTIPIIISTISLANNSTSIDKEITQTTNKPESIVDPKSKLAVPRIKVKPVSELMPEKNQPQSSVSPSNNWNTNFYNGGQNTRVQNENIPIVYMINNAASCSNTNSQQTSNSYPQYKMNTNSSNIPVTPCSNASNVIVNPQQNEQAYTSNYSQYNIHTHRSNIFVPPNSNASSGIINSEQPNTSYSHYIMNQTSSNICATPSSNASSSMLNSQQPNTNYSQYSMNTTSSNIRDRLTSNASSSMLNSQQPNTNYSQYSMNATSSNVRDTLTSNASSSMLNSQQPNTNYSQYSMNATSSNVRDTLTSNASSSMLNSQQPNTNYSQYSMNATSSNVRDTPTSNASSSILNSQQPNTNYSQYPMNAASSNIRVTACSNASSSNVNFQQPNASHSQYIATSSNGLVTQSSNESSNIDINRRPNTSYVPYDMNITTSNLHAIPSCSNVISQPSNTVGTSLYNNNNNNSKSPNVALASSLKISSEKIDTQKPSNEQYVKMQVELPKKKTNSPFRCLQDLLEIHNLVLLDSVGVASNPMSCLIKFKLEFHQEFNAAVTLCLSLFYKENTFCIRVNDVDSKFLDIAKLSPYWQWEILKEFKGDIVTKLYENASKIGPDVLNKTNYFVTLLSTIVYTK
ncbi:unnamed protein product [Euphydryas editha]|uniref:Uncharacterized protein n=1 Tax=Euphydryas editha TaxID=104508 RepID=A0AAU9UMR7_EUPED|nr:unnamed protein product [Euphydryas editha]